MRPSELAAKGRDRANWALVANPDDELAKLLLAASEELARQVEANVRMEDAIHEMTKEDR